MSEMKNKVVMVTGGGAMHLDDAIGHKEGINCVFNHHE
jgi:acetolactate synthase-1/2/3 large subunit